MLAELVEQQAQAAWQAEAGLAEVFTDEELLEIGADANLAGFAGPMELRRWERLHWGATSAVDTARVQRPGRPRVARSRQSHARRRGHRRVSASRGPPDSGDDGPAASEPPERRLTHAHTRAGVRS
jgi:hypothetical protein